MGRAQLRGDNSMIEVNEKMVGFDSIRRRNSPPNEDRWLEWKNQHVFLGKSESDDSTMHLEAERRTWGPAHYTLELVEHLEWWRTYFHFVRFHESLAVALATPSQRKGKQGPLLPTKQISCRTPYLNGPNPTLRKVDI